MRRHFVSVSLPCVLILCGFAIPPCALGSDLEQHLRDEYRDKTFVLRSFYSGDQLRYDSSGELIGGGAPGDWTSDGFVLIKEIHSSSRGLELNARRMLVIEAKGKEFQFLQENDKDRPGLKIQVEMHNPSPEQVDMALAKIFLTAQDQLANVVSSYWAPCLRAAGGGQDERFRFGPKLASVPGVAGSQAGTAASTAAGEKPPLDCSTHFTHRRGVHPTPIYQPPPEYSEEARRAKYQGTVVLMLVVDEMGIPTNVRILSPLGMGLDEKALECVRKWKFQPAQDQGHPIPMEIAVEVEFHLY